MHELPAALDPRRVEIIVRVAAFVLRSTVTYLQVDDLFLGFIDESVTIARARRNVSPSPLPSQAPICRASLQTRRTLGPKLEMLVRVAL